MKCDKKNKKIVFWCQISEEIRIFACRNEAADAATHLMHSLESRIFTFN